MSSPLPASIVRAIDESKIVGVRAGARSSHRFIGVWMVVVGGRVYARSWTGEPDGWYRAFLQDSAGAIQVGGRTVRVRAVQRRDRRVWAAIERAYREKYNTPGSLKYVRGFRTPARRATTLEFVRREGGR
jgi:hypothetical protein